MNIASFYGLLKSKDRKNSICNYSLRAENSNDLDLFIRELDM